MCARGRTRAVFLRAREREKNEQRMSIGGEVTSPRASLVMEFFRCEREGDLGREKKSKKRR